MSHSIVITANAPKALVDAASMQGLDLNIGRIMAYCADDLELQDVLHYAKEQGVEIKGVSHTQLKQRRFELGKIGMMFCFLVALIMGAALVALLPSSLLLGQIVQALSGL